MEDYSEIKKIIDDIVGVETKQGENLKIAIKNYFDTKLRNIKLANSDYINNQATYSSIKSFTEDAGAAMKRYTAKLKEDLNELKINGGYCGIDSSD